MSDDTPDHRLPLDLRSDMTCPFCDETGFDAAGLKLHLRKCLAFDGVDTALPRTAQRFEPRDYGLRRTPPG